MHARPSCMTSLHSWVSLLQVSHELIDLAMHFGPWAKGFKRKHPHGYVPRRPQGEAAGGAHDQRASWGSTSRDADDFAAADAAAGAGYSGRTAPAAAAAAVAAAPSPALPSGVAAAVAAIEAALAKERGGASLVPQGARAAQSVFQLPAHLTTNSAMDKSFRPHVGSGGVGGGSGGGWGGGGGGGGRGGRFGGLGAVGSEPGRMASHPVDSGTPNQQMFASAGTLSSSQPQPSVAAGALAGDATAAPAPAPAPAPGLPAGMHPDRMAMIMAHKASNPPFGGRPPA